MALSLMALENQVKASFSRLLLKSCEFKKQKQGNCCILFLFVELFCGFINFSEVIFGFKK